MLEAIRKSGFTPVPEETSLVLTGKLEARDGGFVLTLDKMNEPRAVSCLGAQDLLERSIAQNPGQIVEVQGHWQFEGQGGISVEKVELARD